MSKQEDDIRTITYSSKNEIANRENFFELFRECPIPENELLSNLELFIKRQDMTRILFMNDLYKKIIDVNGIVTEFGVRWGRNLALLESFRGIYEPYNYNRKLVGFDTFAGFPSIHSKDGDEDIASVGAFSTTKNYDEYLKRVLDYHEQESPIAHIKKYQLVKGDATVEVVNYLKEYPETIIAFAYFDFDIYEPTKKCLDVIKNHFTKGTVLAFDQLNLHAFPGETLALKDAIGLDKYKITRSPYSSNQSYIVID